MNNPEVKIIKLPLPLKMGSVNCYLLAADSGYILFDSGGANNRTALLEALAGAGCQPGDLSLIVLTHGDFDHTANAAYLRKEYGVRIAMHPDDAGMVEQGDMFWNRSQPNLIIKLISSLVFRLGKADRFVPDLLLNDGDTLAPYGLEAEVVHLPGHSLGSIGIRLAGNHDLIGGDLMDNVKAPGLNSLMDDTAAAQASIEKLAALDIRTVYPGHGTPFLMAQFST